MKDHDISTVDLLKTDYIVSHHPDMYKLVGCENLIIITWYEISNRDLKKT